MGYLGYIGAWQLYNLQVDDVRWKRICSNGITLVKEEATLLLGFSEQLAKATQ